MARATHGSLHPPYRMLGEGNLPSLSFLFTLIGVAPCPFTPFTMLKILYTQEPDGKILYYDCYNNQFDRRGAYDYLLEQGYEIVGEE